MYNYNIDKLVLDLIPPVLRTNTMIAWCKLMVWPLQQLWTKVLLHYNDIDNIVSSNSQKIYLAHFIARYANCAVDIVDNVDVLPNIYYYKISDDILDEQYIYTIGQEMENIYIFTNYNYQSDADYIILIGPLTESNMRIANDLAKIYNPAGKKYQIKILIT